MERVDAQSDDFLVSGPPGAIPAPFEARFGISERFYAERIGSHANTTESRRSHDPRLEPSGGRSGTSRGQIRTLRELFCRTS